jgi:hypothetical protein
MTQLDRSEGAGEPRRGELVRARPPESTMREWAERLVARAREDGVALTGEGGLLTDLMRHVLQTGLEVEMAEHLGYERGEAPPGGVGNARNGAYDKTVTTELGEVELRIPRDRKGTFEPTTVPKYQRRLATHDDPVRCRADGTSGRCFLAHSREPLRFVQPVARCPHHFLTGRHPIREEHRQQRVAVDSVPARERPRASRRSGCGLRGRAGCRGCGSPRSRR